jgi:hypothetical protein
LGGKSSQSTSQVTVPPDVLQRYDAVNAQAQATAAQPFQQYSGQFVAPVNAQQDAGIAGINAGANLAQPYYAQASTDVTGAMNAAQPYYAGASTDVTGAQSIGNQLGAASLSDILGGGAAAAPWQNAAGANYGSAYAGAQPYQIGATGLALAGGQAVNPYQITPEAINQFMSPYLQTVLGSTANVLNQNNQQQQAGQLGDAIRSGAFGGDRAGIGAANLEEQQNLANANIYSGIMNQGFNTALGAAQQQQGTFLGAGQANRAALQEAAGQLAGIGQQGYQQGMGLGSAQQGLGAQLFGQGMTQSQLLAALGQQQFGQGISAANTQAGIGQDVFGTGAATSQQLANIGTSAQQSALAGAQAQLGAGTLQQQTQQAQDTALYNQFLQQQAYPFQVDQFLANIAEGTGALSGSTTTTTTPGGLFSDERLKEDIRPVGKTYDGQNIVQFRYKGDPTPRIGLIAQEVEKKHPGAVGQSQGFKTVDYGRATDEAAEKGHFRKGGPIPSNDNAGLEPRKAYAYGGYPSEPGIWPADIAAILQSQASMYAPYSGGQTGVYGGAGQGLPRGGGSYVPSASLPVSHLAVSNFQPPQQNKLQQANQIANLASNKAVDTGVQDAMGWLNNLLNKQTVDAPNMPIINPSDLPPVNPDIPPLGGLGQSNMKRGGLVPRKRYDDGGDIPYDPTQDNGPYGPRLNIPDDNPKNQLPTAKGGAGAGTSPLSQIGGLAQGLGSLASGVGAIGGMMGLGSTAAGLGAAAGGGMMADLLPLLGLFAKGGSVRKGYGDGGDPTSEPGDPDATLALASGNTGGGSTTQEDLARAAAQAKAQTAGIIASGLGLLANPASVLSGGMGAATGAQDVALGTPAANAQPLPGLAPASANAATPPPRGLVPSARAPSGLAPANNNSMPGISDAMDASPAFVNPGSGNAGAGASLSNPTARTAPGLSPTDPLSSQSGAGLQPTLPPVRNSANAGTSQQAQSLDAKLSGSPSSAPSNSPNGIGGVLGGLGKGIEGIAGNAVNWAHNNPAALMSILSGIGAMGAAQTKYPLIALTQGLGAAGQTYGNIKGQLANAQVEQTAAFKALHPPPAGGPWTWVGDPQTGHWVPSATLIGGAAGAGQSAPVPSQPLGKALTMDYTTGRAAIGPSPEAESAVAQQYKGFDPTANPITNRAMVEAQNPEFAKNNTNDEALGTAALANQDSAYQTQRTYVQLADALSQLSPGALGTGAHFEDRMHLANLYNTYTNALGIAPDPSITAQLSSSQIIAKIDNLQALALANKYGQTSQGIAQGLQGVLPSGQQTPQAAFHVLSQLMVQNQRERDFGNYYNTYTNQNGFAAGAYQAFNHDYQPRYAQEQQQLESNLPKIFHHAGSGVPSTYDLISKDPKNLQKFEQGTTVNGQQVPGFGEGFSRYLL